MQINILSLSLLLFCKNCLSLNYLVWLDIDFSRRKRDKIEIFITYNAWWLSSSYILEFWLSFRFFLYSNTDQVHDSKLLASRRLRGSPGCSLPGLPAAFLRQRISSVRRELNTSFRSFSRFCFMFSKKFINIHLWLLCFKYNHKIDD